MRYLVATEETQGEQKGDFCFVPTGEPVYFGTECSRERIDGACGCRRSMVGASCLRATTSFAVVEGLSEEMLGTIIIESHRKAGWGDELGDAEAHREHAKAIGQVAGHFPVGTILGRRGRHLYVRRAACTG